MADVKTDLDMGDVWMMLARSWLRNNKRKTPKSQQPKPVVSLMEMGLMPTDREKLVAILDSINVTSAFDPEQVADEILALPDTEPQGDDEPIVTEAMIEAGELELPHAYGREKAAEIVTRIYTAMSAAATGGTEGDRA